MAKAATCPTYVGFIAMSLDGFIADDTGSVVWLDPFNEALAADGNDGGYGAFITPVDALLMGRTTYEQVMGWGWPYNGRAGYVLTRQQGFTGDQVASAGDIQTLGAAIAKAGHKTVWVMGGGVAQRLALDAGMFDSLCVFVMPTLLGSGHPCFAAGKQHNLNFVSSANLAGGILQINYTFGD